MKHLLLFETYTQTYHNHSQSNVSTTPDVSDKLLKSYGNWKIEWNHNINYNHDILDRIRKRTGLTIDQINTKLKKVIDRIDALIYGGKIKDTSTSDYAFKMKESEFTFLINIDDNSLYIRTILDKGMKIYHTQDQFTLFEGKKYTNIAF